MKLKIKNFAKIKEADIILNGITVIAGQNNTGKSTVGKILHSFYKTFKDYQKEIESQRNQRIDELISNYIYISNSSYDSDDYSDIANKLSKYLYSYISNKSEDNYKSIISVCKRLKNFYMEEAEKLITEVVTTSEISDDSILRRIITTQFGNTFNGQLNNVNNENPAELKVQILNSNTELNFENNLCSKVNSPINIIKSSFFIDNPNTLNNLNSFGRCHFFHGDFEQILFGGNMRTIYDFKISQPNLISEMITNDKLNNIFHILNDKEIGNIIKRDKGNYIYKNSSLTQPLNIENLSMGLKSLVLLKSLLKENVIKEKDVLIFDEPEIHLHPEWQILYAQVLVLLQVTFDLTLVITSHSPYFIDAINLFAAKYDSLKNCNFYLSEMENNEVTFKNVTNNIDKIYEKLADPFDYLDTLRYELEEEGKL